MSGCGRSARTRGSIFTRERLTKSTPTCWFACSTRSASTAVSASADARMVAHHALEVGAVEDGARGRLERHDRRGARLARDERHLAEHLAGAELGELELDAARRILPADRDAARLNEERRVARAALADDDRLRRKLAVLHPLLELAAFLRRQTGKKRQRVKKRHLGLCHADIMQQHAYNPTHRGDGRDVHSWPNAICPAPAVQRK